MCIIQLYIPCLENKKIATFFHQIKKNKPVIFVENWIQFYEY